MGEILDECSIDLDVIEIEFSQITKRVVPAPKIVQGEGKSFFPQFPQKCSHAGNIFDRLPFRNFEFDLSRGDSQLFAKFPGKVQESMDFDLLGGKVDLERVPLGEGDERDGGGFMRSSFQRVLL